MLCSYQFDSERSGRLQLGLALYNSLPHTSYASLTPTDGEPQRVRIILDPSAGEATFELVVAD